MLKILNVLTCIILIFSLIDVASSRFSLKVSRNDLKLAATYDDTVYIQIKGSYERQVIYIETVIPTDKGKIIDFYPNLIRIEGSKNKTKSHSIFLTIIALNPGWTTLSVRTEELYHQAYIRVEVAKQKSLLYVAKVCGWLYFTAWSISYYPQVWRTWQAGNVCRMNINQLALDFVGSCLYLLYNAVHYWSWENGEEYVECFNSGLNPVRANDVAFSIHTIIFQIILISQCCIYNDNSQSISSSTYVTMAFYGFIVLIMMFMAGGDVVPWLYFIILCSYVKLVITVVKFMKKTVLIFRKQSTEGYSVRKVISDLLGGVFGFLQMYINGYNYSDFTGLYGNFAKLGLAVFSIFFDILFVIQRSYLYGKLRSEGRF